eukprot:scaffold5586_cov170-Skeletonema_marinoi.AAC.3
MAQKSVESIRNQLETTGHNAHVPRRSFVAVTHDGGRKFLKSSEKSHLRPRHEARRNARVEST